MMNFEVFLMLVYYSGVLDIGNLSYSLICDSQTWLKVVLNYEKKFDNFDQFKYQKQIKLCKNTI